MMGSSMSQHQSYRHGKAGRGYDGVEDEREGCFGRLHGKYERSHSRKDQEGYLIGFTGHRLWGVVWL